jgi:hypothetical protein
MNVNPEEIPYEIRRELLNKYPETAARHFSMRVGKFVTLMKQNSEFIFGRNLIDYTYRVEFQSRGSPHIHCLLWMKDVPEWTSPEGVAFMERNITCSLDSESRDLVLKYQCHRHSATCYKGESRVCRFGFPRQLVGETIIHDEDEIVGNGEKFVSLKRKNNETMINNYHPILLQLLKCNIDIQAVTSAAGVAYYIAKYISKAEPLELRESIRNAIDKIKSSSGPVQKKMLRMASTLMRKREISAQEECYRICHLPLRRSSRAVVTIPSFRKEQGMRMLDREALIRGETKFCDNIMERYMHRPDCLLPICLFEFAAHFTLKRMSPAYKDKSNEEDLVEFPEDNDGINDLEATEYRLKNIKGVVKKGNACM